MIKSVDIVLRNQVIERNYRKLQMSYNAYIQKLFIEKFVKQRKNTTRNKINLDRA